MKQTAKLAPLLLTLMASACGAYSPDDTSGIESEIVNGNGQNPVSQGVALIDVARPNCSGTMMDTDWMLTFSGCQDTGTVAVDTLSSKVRMRRTGFALGGDVVAFQTSKRIMPANYARDVDTTPLSVGDQVTCVGYDDTANPKLHSGSFEVADGSSNTKYYLAPVATSREVSFLDLGGFCSRDGSTEIAAILTGPSVNGIATATPMHAARQAVKDLRRAASAARGGAAVRFRATTAMNTEFMTDELVLPPIVGIGPLSGIGAHQAFYLERVQTPPAGGSDWYRLVIPQDGRCVFEEPADHTVRSGSCRSGRREEIFQVESLGNLQYRIRAAGGCVDQVAAPGFVEGPSVGRCNGAPSQIWEMWLTRL
jgi:hypothetical protein